MTDFQRNALLVLVRYGPSSAAVLDPKFFEGTQDRLRGCRIDGGGPYPTQMLLGRLRKKGWAETLHTPGSSVWGITPAGRAVLRHVTNVSEDDFVAEMDRRVQYAYNMPKEKS